MTGRRNQYAARELVVGAGLTGLSYGIALAQAGEDVAIVEHHSKPGGYATNFFRTHKRKAYIFDCSLHKITGFGVKGNLENALARLGVLDQIEFLSFSQLTNFHVGGRVYSFSADFNEFQRQIKATFPGDIVGLCQFFKDIKTHGYQNYMIARMNMGEYELDRNLIRDTLRLSKMTARQYFKSLFRADDLVNLLSSIAINLGVAAEEADALYFLHFAYTFFVNRLMYIKGSSQFLSDTLAEHFQDLGGRIFYNQRATGIRLHGKAVQALTTQDTTFLSRSITTTCSPHTVVDMIGRDNFDEKYLRCLGKLQFGLGGFAIYLGLKKPAEQIGIEGVENLLASEDYPSREFGEDPWERYDHWPISVYNYHKLDDHYGPVLKILILDNAGEWFALNPRQYRERKKQVCERILKRVCSRFPRLRENIEFTVTSTPKTNHRYTLSPGGSSFGYRPVPGRNLRFLYQQPIAGLKSIGTWINGAGYESAICLGFSEATQVINTRQEEIHGQFRSQM